MFMCVHTCVCVYVYICMCVHVYMYVCMFVYMCACVLYFSFIFFNFFGSTPCWADKKDIGDGIELTLNEEK